MNLQKILIAIDEEPVAAHAAEIGMELAAALQSAVAFVHAIDPGLSQAPGLTPAELIARAESDARNSIAAACRRMPQVPAPSQFIRLGKPAAEIVRTAKDWAADMIVIGSHGRHGVSRALLGSVAEEVMRHAPCPVLVVRPRE